MMGQCKLCLQNKKLINAHIIPKYFNAGDSKLYSEKLPYALKRPTGTYDANILCSTCDGEIIGTLDNYAKKVLIDRKGAIKKIKYPPTNYEKPITFYSLQNKNGYVKLARFFISILWRMSVSLHSDFCHFSLGDFEETAKKSILDEEYCFKNYFEVSIFVADNTYPSKINLISGGFIQIHDVRYYPMMIGSHKALIKCDVKPTPNIMKVGILGKDDDILMIEGVAQKLPEHKILVELILKKQKSTKNYKLDVQ